MKKFFKRLFVLLLVFAIYVVILRVIFPLPDISQRPPEYALASDPITFLGGHYNEGQLSHPDKTGVIPLPDGNDALGSRLALAGKAEHSIDVQYYIWHHDVSGTLLLKALYDASRRGVKVRLLLDDNGIPGLDDTLTALNNLDNFEVRIFNPSMLRSPRSLAYSFDFFRLNRRMHNKAFIADGSVAIIGGRNVGDEYFQVGDESFFIDMDVIGMGAVVPKTSAAFDEYWNSQSAYKIDSFIETVGNLNAFLTKASEVQSSDIAKATQQSIYSNVQKMIAENVTWEWTKVELAYDNPLKGLGKARKDQLLIEKMVDMLGEVKHRLNLVSAYFIPGDKGEDYFIKQASSGKDVRILTNAMTTTDVLMVHAGYSKYRRDLLKSGVKLYELKPGVTGREPIEEDHKNDDDDEEEKPSSNSSASLHAKTFSIDGDRIFIGSFNFDPRSVYLNCEMGFLIHSSKMARELDLAFDGPIKHASYQPQLTPKNKMIWNEAKKDGEIITYQEEPDASWLQQVAVVIVGWLPVEWLL